MRRRVAVVGAAGFVGQAVVERLVAEYEVMALTQRALIQPPPQRQNLEWRKCDLFSQIDIEQGILGAECAVYLVHSLMPSAQLVQGNAQDRELILASNFAQCAAKAKLKQIIHVIPRVEGAHSEVAQVLRSGTVPVTTLKASAILGRGGAAFQLVDRMTSLRKRVFLPAWAWVNIAAVDVADLVEVIARCVFNEKTFQVTADVASSESASLVSLLEIAARLKGRSWKAQKVPGRWERLSPWLLSRWASLPLVRVQALMRGLLGPQASLDLQLQNALGLRPRSMETSLREALEGPPLAKTRRVVRGFHERDVRSIQRLPLPAGWTAASVATAYTQWLPRFLFPLVTVKTSLQKNVSISLRGFPWPLLELYFAPTRSTADRQLFYISGGWLARAHSVPNVRPRLEFREVPGQPFVVAAIHDFAPRLPWVLYRTTQALVHLGVMRSFSRYLKRLQNTGATR